MSSYRRFVAYVYEYHGEQKKGNRGFVKVESRNGNCVIDVHLHCPNLAPDQDCSIYGFVRKNQDLHGIELGRCKTAPGKIECRLNTRADSLNGQPVRLDDLGGMVFLLDGGGFYGTQWDDAPISPMAFKLPKKEVKPERPVRDAAPQKEPVDIEHPRTDAAGENIESPKAGERAENMEGMQPMPRENMEAPREEISEESGGERETGEADVEAPDGKSMRAAESDVFQTEEADGEIAEAEAADPAEGAGISMEDAVRTADNEDAGAAWEMQKESTQGEPQQEEAMPEDSVQEEAVWEETKQEAAGPVEALPEDSVWNEAVQEESEPEEAVWGESVQEEAEPGDFEASEVMSEESEPEKTLQEAASEEIREEFMTEESVEADAMPAGTVPREAMPEEIARERFGPEGAVPEENRQSPNRPLREPTLAEPGRRMDRESGSQEFWPFEDGEIIECRKIEPQEFRFFQRRDWPLKNNRFLLHGFYQFGYLLIGKLRSTNQYILGVPGVYDQQERFMANMFGFPHFKTSRLPEFSRVAGGKGGFWYRLINTPNFHQGNRR
ncbi:MAG: hypothetical protein ACOYBE_04020 [Blautia sp.]